MPTLYYYVFASNQPLETSQLRTVEFLSEEIAVILAVVYVLSLVFTLFTHRTLFDSQPQAPGGAASEPAGPRWSRTTATLVLVAAAAGVGLMGELLVHSVDQAAAELGMSRVFVGVIVVAIVGNAAEHSTAVTVALKNKMDLSVQIAVGSGIQIALFVAPVLVFSSMAMGHERPLDLHFTPMEIVAVAISIIVLADICQDGETHWLEGIMLLAVCRPGRLPPLAGKPGRHNRAGCPAQHSFSSLRAVSAGRDTSHVKRPACGGRR
jgi:Ca2+:H+ antiporter